MVNKNESLNWKTAAIVGAVAVATSVGIYYYIRSRENPRENEQLLVDNINDTVDSVKDPLKASLDLKDRGNAYFKGGKYENALKCYMDALDICPLSEKTERARLFQNKAVALENLGRQDEVKPNLDEALNLLPRYEKALNRRSKYYESQGQYREGLIDVTAAAIFDNFKTPEYLNRMELLVKKIGETEMAHVLSSSMLTLQSDRYISIYTKSFPSDPLMEKDDIGDSEDTTLNAIERCLDLYRNEQFERSFDEVRSLLSSEADLTEEAISRLLLLRGTFYTLSCREDLALQDLDAVISNNHARPAVTVNALIKRAMLMMVADNVAEVEKSFTEALQIDPDCPDIYYHRGSFYESCAKLDESISDFTRALELMSQYSFAAIHKAYNDYQRNKMVGSVTLDPFKELMEQFPSCVECHVIYAQILLSEGMVREAEKLCESILGVHPGAGTILMTLAMVKLSQEKVAEAKRILQDTIRSDPKYAFSYHTLATVYIKDGDLQKAIELMDAAVRFARNKQELQNFIATREGVRAQLNVSVNYGIPPAEIFGQMMRAASMM